MAGLPSAPPQKPRPYRRGVMRFAAVLSLLVCGGLLAPAALQYASAQELAFPPTPPKPPKSKIAIDREKSGDKQMLVQAREINYDYNGKKVSAVGGVQIYYGGSTIEADRVIYDQASKRLRAEGNVRLTEDSGNVTYGEVMDLTDDYRDGFVDSLRLDTPDQTRMAATRADRTSGNYTVFHDGVYTACKPCADNPKKPPLWQVKAARVIHDQNEKMIYFEDAKLEILRHADGMAAVFLGARPDRQAQDRLPDAEHRLKQNIRAGSRNSVLLGVGAELRRHLLADVSRPSRALLLQGEFSPAHADRPVRHPRRRYQTTSTRITFQTAGPRN